MEVLYAKFQATRLQLIILDISKPFENNFLRPFRVWEENSGVHLMSQYQPCIRDELNFVIKLFHDFEGMLWKCYHVTINSPYFTFFARLMQRWCNVVVPTSRRRCEFDIAVLTLHRRYHYKIHDILCGELVNLG